MLTLNITEIATVREAMATAVLLVDLIIFLGDILAMTPKGFKAEERTFINKVVHRGTKREIPNNIRKTDKRLKTKLFVENTITK
jgi:hypothetical protein